MTAFEICVDTAIDEMAIELVENNSLPTVVDERSPYHFQVDFKDDVWTCEGFYRCREKPDEFVTVRRQYSTETIEAIATFYDGLDEDD